LGLTALLVDPARLATIYAATRGGLYKSVNGGASWAFMSHGQANTDVQALALGAPGSGVVFAGTSAAQALSGIYKSLDGGATWSPSSQGVSTFAATTFDVSPQGASTMFAANLPRNMPTLSPATSW
ncbi:MAG: hypothetical protein JOZ15_01040, partial [Acidobacteria bacterium]|nr:hypothetical protein [Acidobacteriota bacterium]